MCSTGLNACNLGYRGQRHRMNHRCHGKHGEHRKKTVQVARRSSRKRRVVQAHWTRERRNDFSPDPRFPQSPPKWVKSNFLLHCHKKCQFCSTQEIKDNLNFAPKVFQTTHTIGRSRKVFTDILAGFTVNNRVLRLPAIVLLNTTFRPGNSGLLRVYVQDKATKKYKWICLESLDVYPKKARVSGSKRRVQ